jgi:hypothetical protein
MTEAARPSRDDGVAIRRAACALCDRPFLPAGRRPFCSDARRRAPCARRARRAHWQRTGADACTPMPVRVGATPRQAVGDSPTATGGHGRLREGAGDPAASS